MSCIRRHPTDPNIGSIDTNVGIRIGIRIRRSMLEIWIQALHLYVLTTGFKRRQGYPLGWNVMVWVLFIFFTLTTIPSRSKMKGGQTHSSLR